MLSVVAAALNFGFEPEAVPGAHAADANNSLNVPSLAVELVDNLRFSVPAFGIFGYFFI